MIESVKRIEPALIDDIPTVLADLVADVSAGAAHLGTKLHPKTAENLAQMVRFMNTYYSNLIEGHHTKPRDIERFLNIGGVWPKYPDEPPSSVQIESALDSSDYSIPLGNLSRDLLVEAVAHVRVQESIDKQNLDNALPESASANYIQLLHSKFYDGASDNMLKIGEGKAAYLMVSGKWRTSHQQDVVVGLHHPLSSERVADFMEHFAQRYRFKNMGTASRIISMVCAHH